jgi:peroxiredoxin
MNLLPDADLFFWEKKKLVRKSVHSLFEGKDILLVSVCGAFTPPCTEMVKEYEAMYDKFIKDTVVDDIYIVSMNDSFVMDKWFKSMKIKKCKYLPDGNGAYILRLAKQGGMAAAQCSVQMYNKGMGVRAWRWVLLIENNIQMSYLEEETPDNKGSRDNLEEDPFELTHAQQAYDMLISRDQVDHINEINAEADKGMHRPEGIPISPGG